MPYVRTRLGRLFYDERGSERRPGDPAIVLLHGLLFDGGMWRGQIEPLAALGRVLVFDGPGHGKSEPPPRFMLEEHADALFDAFGELGVKRAVLVGLSWGGMVGMRFALQHDASVAALALLDTSADTYGLKDKVRYRAFIAMHRRIGTPRALFDKEIAPELFSARTIRERPELVDAAYRRSAGFDRGGAARAALAVITHRTNILDKLGRIYAPTLVMTGSEDRATPPSHAQAIANGIPGSRLVILQGLGHMSPLEDSEAVNAELVPFVRENVSRS
jgi:pimeloyl-ACP methyl ester carboxylesterase